MGLYRFSSLRGAHGERLLRRYPPDPPPPPLPSPPPVSAVPASPGAANSGHRGRHRAPQRGAFPGSRSGDRHQLRSVGIRRRVHRPEGGGGCGHRGCPPWGCSHALNARPPLTVVLLAGHVGGGVAGDVEGDEHLALLAVPLQLAVVGAEEEEGREAGSGGGRPSRRQQGSQRGQQAGPAPGDAPPPLHAAAAGAAGASRARRDRRAAPLLSAPRGTGRDETRRDGARGGTDGAGRGGRCPPAEPAEVRGARSGAERRGAERGKGHRGPSALAEGCAAPSGSAVPVYRCRGAGLGAGSARAGNNLFPPVSGWEGGEGPSSSSTSFSSSAGAARSSRSSLCAPGCGAASAGRRAAGPALSLPFVCRRSLPTGPRPCPGPWRCSLVPGPAPAAGPALAAAPTPESLCPCPVSPTSVSLPLSLSHILSPYPTAQSLCSHPGSLLFCPYPSSLLPAPLTASVPVLPQLCP